jgi:hypothetical protein
MLSLKHTLLIVTLLTSCVGCDQVTKEFARPHLAFEPPYPDSMASFGFNMPRMQGRF